MHRMGPFNTRLRDLAEIRESIRAQAVALEALAPLEITTVSAARRLSVIDKTWSVLTALRVSMADAQIVANSKVLHHLLPALVPPMDRHEPQDVGGDEEDRSDEDVATGMSHAADSTT